MKVGDIVKVRLKSAPRTVRVGIIIRKARKMYMAGEILEVMVDGNIQYVKREHAEVMKEIDELERHCAEA